VKEAKSFNVDYSNVSLPKNHNGLSIYDIVAKLSGCKVSHEDAVWMSSPFHNYDVSISEDKTKIVVERIPDVTCLVSSKEWERMYRFLVGIEDAQRKKP
jgi:hypothetical protein